MEVRVERRKHKRFSARDGSIAALKKNNINSKCGIITDISRGGLAFRYLAYIHDHDKEAEEQFEVDILYEVNHFFLLNMPCIIVQDNYIPPEYSFSLGLMRKCRIRFGTLASYQIPPLEYFLTHCTHCTV